MNVRKYFLTSLKTASIAIGLLHQTTQASVFVPPTTDRTQTQLNGTWKFFPSNTLTGAQVNNFDDSSWATVSVPHTWDSIDTRTHYTNSWYRTHFTVPSSDAGQRIYVYFEGAFQVADVYVNGTLVGEHRGGYTWFKFDASSAINFGGDNVLAVQVSSASCSDALPDGLPRLWKGYGGIYRKAWIITANQYHVSDLDYSSNGLYVTQSNVSSSSASVSMVTVVGNSSAASQTFTVNNIITDVNQNIVLNLQRSVSVPANSSVYVTQTGTVSSPNLWSKSNPYLYNVYADVSVGGTVTDSVADKIGFRYYQLTTSDFKLNGVSDKLRGISKHQETEYNVTAMSDADLTTDWNNIGDLGVNFVRLPHYPHARLEYDLADQMGIMVWAEDGFTNGAAPSTNSNNLVREMVYQNFNHPSIIFWSAGNEASNTSYVPDYAQVIKAADPSRPTVYANSGQTAGNFANVDFEFINPYPGWYYGSMYDFASAGAAYHYISESGAGQVISTHTADYFATHKAVDSFEPEEYGQLDNEVKFQTLFVTAPSTIPAFSNWSFRDFADSKYKSFLNTKGLMTDANFKKDIYYHYKSFLSSSPVVHIVGADYFLRSANPSGQGDVKVYSNASSLTLTVNGVSLGKKNDGQYSHPNGTVINHVFFWTNALSLGKNTILADDGNGNIDAITVYYKGSGSTMPAEAGSLVANLSSSNSANPAFYVNRPIADQYPFYIDFDATADNTFDVVPAPLAGGASWIATKRQSNSTATTNLSFDLTGAAYVYIMCTDQGSTPSFVSSAGFTDTGATGQWRDNDLHLVNYKLYKKSLASGSHVNLGSAAIDYIVLLQNAGPTYQTEDLIVQSASSGDEHEIVVDSRFQNGRGTELFSNGIGDQVTYLVPTVSSRPYNVKVGMKMYHTRGIWQLAIAKVGGGFVNFGAPVDAYSASDAFGEVDLGTWTPSSNSDKLFRFTITGKNASSSGYTAAFDYIKLTPQ